MESDSTIRKHRKPGRPAVFSDAIRTDIGGQHPYLSRRAISNRCFGIRALKILAATDSEKFEWLKSQVTLLGELGRIHNESDLLAVAGQLCELKPTSNTGALLIRRHRLKEGNSTPQRLADAILRSINRYRIRFPDTDDPAIREALQIVLWRVKSALADH